jgi:hypothetical protein
LPIAFPSGYSLFTKTIMADRFFVGAVLYFGMLLTVATALKIESVRGKTRTYIPSFEEGEGSCLLPFRQVARCSPRRSWLMVFVDASCTPACPRRLQKY